MANDIEVSVNFQDIQTLRRELVGVAKDAKSSASVFEREYNKVERSLLKTARANQDYYNSLLKLDKGVKSASSSADVFIKMLDKEAVATERLAAEKEKLAKAFVPLYAQSKLYEEELNKLDRAQELGVISDTQRTASLQRLNDQFAAGSGVFATHTNQMRSAASRMGVVYQQAGYQAGDFFVQVQSGTSILTAFSQQATQMVGMMYLIPEAGMAATISLASLGIAAEITMAQLTLGLSIAIPVITSLASMFMRMAESNDKVNKSAEVSVDVFERLAQATNQLWVERMNLTDPKFDENLVGTKDKLKELTDAYEATTQKVKDLQAIRGRSLNGALATGPAIEAAKQEAIAANAAVKAAKEKLDAYQQEVGLAYARKRIQDQIDAQNEQGIRDLEQQQILQDAFNKKLTIAYTLYARMRGEATTLANETARAANALPSFKTSQLADQYRMYGQGRVAGESAVREASPLYGTPTVSGVGVGGGSRVTQIKETTVALQAETDANKKLEDSMNMVSSNITSAFMSMIDGSQTVAGAFKNMMYNILKSVVEQSIVQPAANSITGLITGMLGGGGGGGLFGHASWSANGNVFGSSGIQAFANGGVVGSPTMFKHGGGLGVMGEAGPEAIMPLKRGSNGKLGVQVDTGKGGNSGGNITVNNNINVVGSDAAMVRAEVTKMIPQITEASKAAVIDAKRRGGQMGAAFQ